MSVSIPAPGRGVPGRVLLVEDEFLIRMLMADYLREEGFTVVEAVNGDEAVAILTAGVLVDLVLSDVQMPGATDGMALLAFVRNTLPYLPIIIMSGHLDPALAIAAGASCFVAKPCELDAIADVLRSHMAGQK